MGGVLHTMRRITTLLIILCSVTLWAQLPTMDAYPTLIQAQNCARTATTCAYSANVTSGNVLIVSEWDQGNVSPGSDPAISDTLVSTWTKQATAAICSGTGGVRWWTATAPSSGADTVTVSGGSTSQETIIVSEWSTNTPTTFDASQSSTFTSQSSVTTPSLTTATNKELLLAAMPQCVAGTDNAYASAPAENFGWGNNGNTGTDAFQITGTNGAYTTSFVIGSAVNGATLSIALKYGSLSVATQAIADGVSGTAYSYKLQARGGTGTYSWSIQSGTLPCGLSLASNGTISGTPTCSAPGAITFKVTDGASSTATASLSIAIGTAFSTPSHVATTNLSNCNVATSIGTVNSGDLIIVSTTPRALQTSSFGPWPKVTGTLLGTVFSPLPGSGSYLNQGGTGGVLTNLVYIGFAPSTGSESVLCSEPVANAQATEFSNIQKIYDADVHNMTLSSGGGSPVTSGSITLPTQELLWSTFMAITQTTTVGAGTGFTSDFTKTGSNVAYSGEYEIGVAAGSATSSFTQSGNTDGHSVLVLYGFRPTKSGTASVGGVKRHSPGVF